MAPALASLDVEMQIQLVAMLLVVARQPGVYQRDMDSIVGVSQSLVSRNVHNLSGYRRDGSPGFELVEQRHDPRDVRSQRLFLTVAGVAFVSRLMGLTTTAASNGPASGPAKDAFAAVHWEVRVD